jgi:2-phospho-L-lactate transferase/gluconeogenesis factor (CofD/UPF0052 family)
MAEAFADARGKKVLLSNLVTKPGQTDGWHVADYVHMIERYVGSEQIEIVLYNEDLPDQDLLSKYAAEGEFPVATDADRFAEISAEPLGANLVAKNVATQDENDKAIRRTLIRHDAHQVGRQLMRVFYE